jgi:polar amino acid transport system substrate-binding protein
MKGVALLGLLFAVSIGTQATAAEESVMKELVPTGKLRVAIAVSPVPSALYVVEDARDQYRGVAIDLGSALAQKLGVAVEFVPYLASGAITADADNSVWNVTFMPVDEQRKKAVAFGNAYHLLQSTYLVAPGSTFKTLADVNAAGTRIAGAAGTATFRASNAASPKATHVEVDGVAAAVVLMKAGKIDCIALSRESLTGLLPEIPGARILDGGFLNSTTAIAVPNGKAEALAYVSRFIEEAKADGLVRKAFDDAGLKTSEVAPGGLKP